jgi:hypothetical protein
MQGNTIVTPPHTFEARQTGHQDAAAATLYSGGHNHCAPVGRAASRIST